MPSYDNEDFTFTINGTEHVLPELSIDLFESIAALYDIKDPVAQMSAWRDAIVGAAEDAATKAAIRSLGVRKVGALFRDWTGIGGKEEAGFKPGEDSSSTD